MFQEKDFQRMLISWDLLCINIRSFLVPEDYGPLITDQCLKGKDIHGNPTIQMLWCFQIFVESPAIKHGSSKFILTPNSSWPTKAKKIYQISANS